MKIGNQTLKMPTSNKESISKRNLFFKNLKNEKVYTGGATYWFLGSIFYFICEIKFVWNMLVYMVLCMT